MHSGAEVYQIRQQDDGSLAALVVDKEGDTFKDAMPVVLSFATAMFGYREYPAMPGKLSVLVFDSPDILKARAWACEMKLTDVIEWREGRIDANEFLARVNYRVAPRI